ncbi:MAG: hypothetical protein HY243_03755 [Proteobacteria bacterium]|nr:hypothetical protein [Pseudomonadota bacterium]
MPNAERPAAVLERFVAQTQDPATFHHEDHVRVAFEMLRHHPFLEAAMHYAAGLKAIAARAGKPGLYNETITIAFLSLIAERMAEGGYADFESLAAASPDLLQRTCLEKWYAPERLRSAIARRIFVLPETRGVG